METINFRAGDARDEFFIRMMLNLSEETCGKILKARTDDEGGGSYDFCLTINGIDVSTEANTVGWDFVSRMVDQCSEELSTKLKRQDRLIREGAEQLLKDKMSDLSAKLDEMGCYADELLEKVYDN